MSLHELLAELQKNYLASIPEKIARIEQLWKAGEIGLLETEYHKLKGTGKTYGLPEVTELGVILEKLCEVNSPNLGQAVATSVTLLDQIRTERLAGREPDLGKNPDFQDLRRQAGGHVHGQ